MPLPSVLAPAPEDDDIAVLRFVYFVTPIEIRTRCQRACAFMTSLFKNRPNERSAPRSFIIFYPTMSNGIEVLQDHWVMLRASNFICTDVAISYRHKFF